MDQTLQRESCPTTVRNWLAGAQDCEIQDRSLSHILKNFPPLDGSVNIIVQNVALEAEAIDLSTEVSLSLKNVSRRFILQTVLDQVGAGETELSFEISELNRTIFISTREGLLNTKSLYQIRVYDLSFLAPKYLDPAKKGSPASQSVHPYEDSDNKIWLDRTVDDIEHLFGWELFIENGGAYYTIVKNYESLKISVRGLPSLHEGLENWINTQKSGSIKKTKKL